MNEISNLHLMLKWKIGKYICLGGNREMGQPCTYHTLACLARGPRPTLEGKGSMVKDL